MDADEAMSGEAFGKAFEGATSGMALSFVPDVDVVIIGFDTLDFGGFQECEFRTGFDGDSCCIMVVGRVHGLGNFSRMALASFRLAGVVFGSISTCRIAAMNSTTCQGASIDSRGVLFSLFLAWGLAFCWRRNSTIWGRPKKAALWRAVLRSALVALALAPWARRSWAAGSWLWAAARARGVMPKAMSSSSGLAPFWMSWSILLVSPVAA